MSDITITADDIVKALRRAVEEKGNAYVVPGYARGYYFRADDPETEEPRPACIFGHAFSYLGIGAGQVPEEQDASAALDALAEEGIYVPPANSYEAEAFSSAADVVQAEQDGGAEWGYSLSLFEPERQRRLAYLREEE